LHFLCPQILSQQRDVLFGLMTFGTVTCRPGSLSRGIFDPAAAHPNKAVAITMPATNAPAKLAVPFSLLFILFSP